MERSRTPLTLVALVLLVSTTVSAAQVDPGWERVMWLRPGTIVTVVVAGERHATGRIAGADVKALRLALLDAGGFVDVIPRVDINVITARLPKQSWMTCGGRMVAGVVGGAYLGMALGTLILSKAGGHVTETTVGSAGYVGAAAGGLIAARTGSCSMVNVTIYRRP